MRIALLVFVNIIVVAILTVITQVGGVLYLLSLATYPFINKKLSNRFVRLGTKLFTFIILYLFGTFLVVPIIARQYNRVPLPWFETQGIQPRTIWTCILNRNYCRPQLKAVMLDVAAKMKKQFPGTVINYLDVSFPIGNSIPLLPHLSHGDGRKADVAFQYIDASSGSPSNTTPSFYGYGVYEGPRNGEINQQWICRKNGFWQDDFFPGEENDHKQLLLDEVRTKALTNLFATNKSIEKIFIEPHLETRLSLTNPKIRFQGCHAARHDNHIHVQVK